MHLNKKYLALIIIILGSVLTACEKKWAIPVNSTYGQEFVINEETLAEYDYIKETDSTCEGLPLEVAVYQYGIEVIDTVEILDSEDARYSLGRDDIIAGICVTPTGSLTFGENEVIPEEIFIVENDILLDAGNIQDVTATAAFALDMDMEGLNGKSLAKKKYEHVVLIFIDGFSYSTYRQAISENLIPNILADSKTYAAILYIRLERPLCPRPF